MRAGAGGVDAATESSSSASGSDMELEFWESIVEKYAERSI